MPTEMFDGEHGGDTTTPPTAPPNCPYCTPVPTSEGWVHAPGCSRNMPARSTREQDVLTNRARLSDLAAEAAFNLDAPMPELGPLGPNAPLDVPEHAPADDELGMGLPTANLTDGSYHGQPAASGLDQAARDRLSQRMQQARQDKQDKQNQQPEPDPDRAAPPAGDDPFVSFMRQIRQQDLSGTPSAPTAKSGSLQEARRRNIERQTQHDADLAAPFGSRKGQPKVEMPAEARRVFNAMRRVHSFFSRVQPHTRAARDEEQATLRRAYREDGAIYGETNEGMWLYHYERLIVNEHGLAAQELIEKQERYRNMHKMRDTLIDDEFRQSSPDDPPR